MGAAASPLPAPPAPPQPEEIDQRVMLQNVSWEQYEAILEARGDEPGLRITYLDGELELMAPSRYHEGDKTRLARIIEAWADERDIPLEGYGAWAVRKRDRQGGAEADECYVLRPHDRDAIEHPDLAIEVVWTREAIDKLEVWRRLGAKEAWIWQEGALHLYRLGDGIEPLTRSELLPDLDPALIAECMAAPSQRDAVRLLRERLRATR